MKDLIPFKYDTRPIRTQIDEETGEVWFVAKDVCTALGISQYRHAVARLDADEGCVVRVHTLGGEQEMTAISESGLYALILRSDKPAAKAFRRWVTKEVLPTIRKTGRYFSIGAAKDGFSLAEIATDFHAAARIAKDIGLKGDIYRRAANNLTLKRTGVDCLSLCNVDLGPEGDTLTLVRDWLSERTVAAPGQGVGASELWRAFNVDMHPIAVTPTAFGRTMIELGMSRRKGATGRIYENIALVAIADNIAQQN